jgi:hypothetical protein
MTEGPGFDHGLSLRSLKPSPLVVDSHPFTTPHPYTRTGVRWNVRKILDRQPSTTVCRWVVDDPGRVLYGSTSRLTPLVLGHGKGLGAATCGRTTVWWYP